MANELYEIISQVERPDIDEAGRFTNFMVVTFKPSCGGVGTVKVPMEKYTVDYVRSQVTAKAQAMCEIANL